MEVIVDHKRTKVIFDNKNNVYIKKFYPNLESKLKFFLKLRKYPGKNFEYIANNLNSLGINVPKIKSVSNYSIVTENIDGVLLSEYLLKDKSMIPNFLDLIVTVLNSGIYFGDFNTNNFIVKDGSIYALDLEDYKKVLFFGRSKEQAIKRLRVTLGNDSWVNYIEKQLAAERYTNKEHSIFA